MLIAFVLAVVGDVVAASAAFANYTNDGSVHCRDWNAGYPNSSLVVYGWKLSPCLSVDSAGQAHLTVSYIVGTTDVRLHARLLSVSNGSTTPASNWQDSQTTVGLNVAQGTQGSYDFGSMPVPSIPGSFVVEATLSESGTTYGWLQSPVVDVNQPAAVVNRPLAPDGQTSCKDQWGADYNWLYLDNRDSGWAPGSTGNPHDYAALSQPGDAFYNAFSNGLHGQSIDFWTNPYKAIGIGGYFRSGESLLDLLNLFNGNYGTSVSEGKYGTDGNHGLRAEINYIRNTCPTTHILLGGYSQGAQVAGDIYDDRGGSGITGMVLFGDPHFNGKGAGDQGVDYDPSAIGILNPIRGDFANGNTNVMSFCNAKDPICQGLPGSLDQVSINAHANYLDKQYPQTAANYFLGHGSRLAPPNTTPTGRFSSFAVNGQSGSEVTVSGAAQLTSFTNGTSSVTYYLDPQIDKSKPLGTSLASDHAATFDTLARFRPVPVGHHLIGAVATVNGAQVDEQRIPVWIQDTTLDHFTVNNSENDYQTVSGTIGLTAIETAASWVMYYYDDQDPVGSGYAHAVPNWPAGGGQYHADTFDTSILSNGPHTITAVAFETYGSGTQVVTRPWLNVKTLHINVQNNGVATFAAPGFQIWGTGCSYSSCPNDHFAQGTVLALTAHEHLATWVEYFANDTKPVNYNSPGELRDSRSGGEPLGGDPKAGPTDHLLYLDLSQMPLGWNTLTAAAFGPNGTVVSVESVSINIYKGPQGTRFMSMIQSGNLAQYGQTTTGGPLIRNTSAPATPTGARDAATASSAITMPATGVTLTQVIEKDGLLHQIGQQTDGTWTDALANNASGQSVPATAVSAVYDTGLGAVVAAAVGTDGTLSQLVQQPDGSWKQSSIATSSGTPIRVSAVAAAYEPDHDAVLVQAVEGDGLLHQLVLQSDGSWTDTTVRTGSATVPSKQVSSAYEYAKGTLVNQVIAADGQLHQIVQNSDGSWNDTSQGIAAKSVQSSFKDSDGSLTSEIVENDGEVHQVVEKSDGSTSDAPAVTDSGDRIDLTPVAVLGARPTPGIAYSVTADASGSKAAGAAIAGYTFDFGDGTVVGPQASPKATHVYSSAGSFTVKVTVNDAIGLSSTATAAVNPSATAAAGTGYVQRVGSDAAKVTGTSSVLPVTTATSGGDTLVVTALLTSTSSLTGAVSATDSQGNSYAVVNDVNDGAAKDRLLTLVAFGTKGLGTTDTVTVSFPSSQEHHISTDEYAGVKAVDQNVGRYDTAEATFNSGPTGQTASDGELVIGAVATEGGDAPQFTSDYTPLALQQVGSDSLLTGYQANASAGVYRASGQVSGPWLASVTTFVPSGPSVLTAKLAANTGSDPMSFTADCSATVRGPNPVTSYTFDFGDGYTAGPQTTATATHAYAQQGAYTVTVTVKDSAGSTSTATSSVTAAPTPRPSPIAYIGRVGGDAVQTSSGKVTITPSGATQANDALIVTALMTNSATGTVAASDTQGNTYTLVNDNNDGAAKDRLVTLAAFGTKPLGTGDTITLTFPTATEHHVAVDEYAGIGAADQHIAANGAAGTVFSSGTTTQATSDDELILGVIATEGGAAPTITGDGSYSALPLQQVGNDSLRSGYRISSSGTAATSGTEAGTWMAQTTTFRAAGPARLTANLSLSVSPTSPMTVQVNAAASTAGAAAISSYTVDFGDGSSPVTQPGATASHTYQAGGTYAVKVTVTDANGNAVVASNSASVTPTSPISYIGRVASDAAAVTSTSLSLHPTASVRPGDTLAVSLMLTNVKSGSVTVSDNRGNSYTSVTDTSDGAGDRTVVFVATNTAAMNAADTITVSYPSNSEHHVAVDEFAGVQAVDKTAAATGSATTFDSGATPTTSAAHELVLGIAGIQGGNATTWSSGFTALPTLLVSQDQLAIAYKIVSATGAYHATGTAQKTWMAGVIAMR